MRTIEQIKAEIVKLKDLQPRVRKVSLFGDDNQAAIGVQILVLEGLLNMHEIYESWGHEEDTAFDQRLLDEAIVAFEWYNDGEDVPSVGWAELVF